MTFENQSSPLPKKPFDWEEYDRFVKEFWEAHKVVEAVRTKFGDKYPDPRCMIFSKKPGELLIQDGGKS